MTFEVLFATLLLGLITGNVVLASGVGVDIAGNNLNSIKNALILSLVIFLITIISGIIIFVTNLIIGSVGMSSALLFVTILVVAIMVQIAEYVLEKVWPVLHALLGEFFVTLIPTISVILLGVFGAGVSFGMMLLDIISISLGVTLILAVISGVRSNKLTHSSYEVFRGNLMTVAILFVLALVWTVF